MSPRHRMDGSVPALLAINRGDRAVLLVNGEELVGAKQNRVLNLTVLVAPRTELKIPVSCVEQGRWHYRSVAFIDSDRAMFAKACACKSRDVTESMAHGTRQADQGAVWHAVAAKLEELQTSSPTHAMGDAFAQRAHSLDEYVAALADHDGECGAIFAIGGAPVALEAFDSADAFGIALPKLVRSYALDALSLEAQHGGDAVDLARADTLLQRIGRINPVRYNAIGLGQDLRVEKGSGLSGGALLLGDRLLHIAVFDAGPGGF